MIFIAENDNQALTVQTRTHSHLDPYERVKQQFIDEDIIYTKVCPDMEIFTAAMQHPRKSNLPKEDLVSHLDNNQISKQSYVYMYKAIQVA